MIPASTPDPDTDTDPGAFTDASPFAHDSAEAADIGFDRIVGAEEAGLGGGFDPTQEARAGITDEALDPVDEAGAPLDPPPGAPGVPPASGDRVRR